MRHSGVHGHCVGPKNGDAATLLGNRPHSHAWNCARSLERSISSLNVVRRIRHAHVGAPNLHQNQRAGIGSGLIIGQPCAAPDFSRAAERRLHALRRKRWHRVARMTRVLFERLGDSVQQVFEGTEIEPVNGGIQRGLNEVVARDVGRIDTLHGDSPRRRITTFHCEALAPRRSPDVIGCRIGELRTDVGVACQAGSGFAKPAECEGEVSGVPGHPVQQILDQLRVTLLPGLQADLATQSIEVGCLKTARKRRERVLCDLDRRLRFRRQQRQQRLGCECRRNNPQMCRLNFPQVS